MQCGERWMYGAHCRIRNKWRMMKIERLVLFWVDRWTFLMGVFAAIEEAIILCGRQCWQGNCQIGNNWKISSKHFRSQSNSLTHFLVILTDFMVSEHDSANLHSESTATLTHWTPVSTDYIRFCCCCSFGFPCSRQHAIEHVYIIFVEDYRWHIAYICLCYMHTGDGKKMPASENENEAGVWRYVFGWRRQRQQ